MYIISQASIQAIPTGMFPTIDRSIATHLTSTGALVRGAITGQQRRAILRVRCVPRASFYQDLLLRRLMTDPGIATTDVDLLKPRRDRKSSINGCR